MNEAPQVRSLTDLAEAAAAAGDCVSAARHLRNLAALQESELGPAHPDLANTLNNLAVVSERAGDLDAAEAAFRRAWGITRTAFNEDHPFVATSDRNLREFCETHGRRYDQQEDGETTAAEPSVAPRRLRGRSGATLVIAGALGGLAAAAVLMWVTMGRRDSGVETRPAPPLAAAKPAPSPDATQTPQVESNLKPEPPLTAPEPVQSREASPASLVSAAVCRDFSTTGGEWRCTPITGSTAAGLLVFYTRVKSTQPMTIEHRWYRGETLQQRLTLRVAANQGAGYRTFSRNTVSADRAGTWRVELRDAAGSVLHQQTFAVQ